jgi:hypothetical protein
VRAGAVQALGARVDPGRDTERRTEREQVATSTAEPAFGLETIEHVLVLYGHENRHRSPARRDLEAFPGLDPAQDFGRVLLQGPYSNPFHVRRCSTWQRPEEGATPQVELVTARASFATCSTSAPTASRPSCPATRRTPSRYAGSHRTAPGSSPHVARSAANDASAAA